LSSSNDLQCSVCGREFPSDKTEVWATEGDELLTVELSSEAYAVAETSLGELQICESCYSLRRKFDLLTPADQRDLHIEFAIEYISRELWEKAIASCRHALDFGPDSRIFFNLGLAHTGLGLTDDAIKSYERAIELDPEDVYAKANLKQLLSKE
jgi:tetratricopeptide (TPR) repeat protein